MSKFLNVWFLDPPECLNCFLNREILGFWCLETNQFKLVPHTMQRSTIAWKEWKKLSLRFFKIARNSTENENLVSAWHPCQKCIRWTYSTEEKTMQQSTFLDGWISGGYICNQLFYAVVLSRNSTTMYGYFAQKAVGINVPKISALLFSMILPHLVSKFVVVLVVSHLVVMQ